MVTGSGQELMAMEQQSMLTRMAFSYITVEDIFYLSRLF